MASVTNPLDDEMEATFFPWLHHDDAENRNADAFDPAERTVCLGPEECRTERFELETTTLTQGDYMIYGYVIGNLDMHVGMTRLLT